MEPSMNQNQSRTVARRRAAQRRKRAQRRRMILWGVCFVLLVVLVFLLVGVLKTIKSQPRPNPPTQSTAPINDVTTVPTNPPKDETPPVIENAVDRVFWLGDSIVYTGKCTRETDQGKVEYQKVTATDDSGRAELTVNRDAVNLEQAGTYPVIYTATDAAGNETSVTVQFTLMEKPKGYIDPETVYNMAQKVLDKITTEDMTDMEVAFAIYNWIKSNIGYVGSSDKSSWTAAAYQAFTEASGDCYNYFAAAKALFTVAGIENVDIVKSDTTHSSHFWSIINLGDGWYHVDCTPRRNVGYFFMNTDAELEAYSVENKNSHIFDGSLYPERATESVQHLVDYKNETIKD